MHQHHHPRPRAVRPRFAQVETLELGVQRWLAERVDNDRHPKPLKKSTRKQYRDAARILVAVLGHLPVEAVERNDIEQLLATVPDGSRPSVFSAWSSCLRALEVPHAVAGIVRPKSRPRKGFLDTHDLPHWLAALELARRLRWARPRTLDCLLALTLVPMRLGELVSLTWPEVDLGARLVRLRDSKTGPRMVSLGLLGASVIAKQPRRAGNDYVWTPARNDGESKHISEDGVSHACTRILRRYTERTGHRFHDEMCAHALRHTWATHAGAAGEKDKAIQFCCGWSTAWMQDRYSHALARELNEATDRVQARLVEGLQLQLEITTS